MLVFLVALYGLNQEIKKEPQLKPVAQANILGWKIEYHLSSKYVLRARTPNLGEAKAGRRVDEDYDGEQWEREEAEKMGK